MDSWVLRVSIPVFFHCTARFLQCLIDQSDCCVQAKGRSSRRSHSVRLETWSITCSFVDCDNFVGEQPEHSDKLSSGRKEYQYTCLPGFSGRPKQGRLGGALILTLVENVEQI